MGTYIFHKARLLYSSFSPHPHPRPRLPIPLHSHPILSPTQLPVPDAEDVYAYLKHRRLINGTLRLVHNPRDASFRIYMDATTNRHRNAAIAAEFRPIYEFLQRWGQTEPFLEWIKTQPTPDTPLSLQVFHAPRDPSNTSLLGGPSMARL